LNNDISNWGRWCYIGFGGSVEAEVGTEAQVKRPSEQNQIELIYIQVFGRK
jgi:hypothetical protein